MATNPVTGSNREDSRGQWLALIGVALLIGLTAGSLAVAFRYSLKTAESARDDWVEGFGAGEWWQRAIPVIACAAAGAMGVWMVQRLAPEAAGSGIPHLKTVLDRGAPMRALRLLPVKFFGGLFAIGAGMALGREGPTAQMGGAAGKLTGRALRIREDILPDLAAVGAGAGLAAAFNAPFASTIFVLEELGRKNARAPLLTLIACVVADLLTRAAFGPAFLFPVVEPLDERWTQLPLAAFIGVVGGLVGVAFNLAILATLERWRGLHRRAPWLLGAMVGALAGLLTFTIPISVGDGHTLIQSLIGGRFVEFAIALLAIRFGLTVLSFGSGAAGGIFSPLLAIGALVGCVSLQWTTTYAPDLTVPIPTAVVFGMAAVLVASLHSPLTGVMLLIELTGDLAALLPLLVASVVALSVAKICRGRPIYDALMDVRGP